MGLLITLPKRGAAELLVQVIKTQLRRRDSEEVMETKGSCIHNVYCKVAPKHAKDKREEELCDDDDVKEASPASPASRGVAGTARAL